MDDTNCAARPARSTVVGQLVDKRVFLTGATGFLGKVFLEKMLRSVPEIGVIYILVRGNPWHPDPGQRLRHDIGRSALFDPLRHAHGADFDAFLNEKIRVVPGDITQRRFGLSDIAFGQLANQIDVVVNLAANVNFRERLDKSLAANVYSLDNVADLATIDRDLPVLHISTCFANGRTHGEILEQSLTAPAESIPREPNGHYRLDGLLNRLRQRIESLQAIHTGRKLAYGLTELGATEANALGWGDVYAFTKWLGEQRLSSRLQGKALTILRPSIVESTLTAPMQGWIEGIKAADVFILAYARGHLNVIPGKPGGILDIVPVDLVANATLLALAELLDAPVAHRFYHCSTGTSNPITLKQFIAHITTAAQRHYIGLDKLFSGRPGTFLSVNPRLFDIVMTSLRFPLLLANRVFCGADGMAQPSLLRRLETARSLASAFRFYTTPNFIFRNDRLLALAKRMAPEEEILFPVDPAGIDWAEYLHNHLAGLNRYSLGGVGN